jgi:hypothetical protein
VDYRSGGTRKCPFGVLRLEAPTISQTGLFFGAVPDEAAPIEAALLVLSRMKGPLCVCNSSTSTFIRSTVSWSEIEDSSL